jgi:hypothetical protein
MSRSYAHWQQAILDRFADRADIGKLELYARYFEEPGLSKQCVMECFELIESEYEIPAGLLRPEDKLAKLVDPVKAKNPLRWLFYRSREEDIESEINHQLAKRMRRHGTLNKWPKVETIDDLIRAWCGLTPTGR